VFGWYGSPRSTSVLVGLAAAVAALAVVATVAFRTMHKTASPPPDPQASQRVASGGDGLWQPIDGAEPRWPTFPPFPTFSDSATPTVTPSVTPDPSLSPSAVPTTTPGQTPTTSRTTTTAATTTTATTTSAPPTLPSNPKTFRAYITGFSYYDNDPPGSATIAYPKVHSKAGGTGTYDDPITAAVEEGAYSPGARFYIPNLRRYFIVEDQCASCTGAWLDLWVDGRAASESGADSCMSAITGDFTVVSNPVQGYPVVSGSIVSSSGCTKQYGDKVPGT
jgi:hypothetical protein